MLNFLRSLFTAGPPGAPENMHEITSTDKLRELAQKSESMPVVLFKHSTRCPISSMALQAFRDFVEVHGEDVHCAYLDLIAHRQVSNAVASEFGVAHQSPQAILLRDGEAVWHESHSAITKAALEQAVAANNSES